jgi:hypothetical protein
MVGSSRSVVCIKEGSQAVLLHKGQCQKVNLVRRIQESQVLYGSKGRRTGQELVNRNPSSMET